MSSRSSSRSIPELFSEAVGQLGKLVGNEFDLVRSELSEKAGQVGRSVSFLGAGAVFLIPTLVLLFLAISAALISSGFSEAMAYLMTAIGGAIVSGILIALGLRGLSGDALKPSLTINEVQRDKIAAREMVR